MHAPNHLTKGQLVYGVIKAVIGGAGRWCVIEGHEDPGGEQYRDQGQGQRSAEAAEGQAVGA